MKTVNALKSVMVLVCAVFMLVLVSCEKEHTSLDKDVLFEDTSMENNLSGNNPLTTTRSVDEVIIVPRPNNMRGTKVVKGRSCAGNWSIFFYDCALYNGDCSDSGPIIFNGDGFLTEIQWITDSKLRFHRLEEIVIDHEFLYNTLMKSDDVNEDNIQELMDDVIHNYHVPKEIPYGVEASALLLKLAGDDKNTKVVKMCGDYKITVDKDHPYGYYDVDVKKM